MTKLLSDENMYRKVSKSPDRLYQYLITQEKSQCNNKLHKLLKNKKLRVSHCHVKELKLLKDSGRC